MSSEDLRETKEMEEKQHMTREQLVRQMRQRELEIKTRKELVDGMLSLEERVAQLEGHGIGSESINGALCEIDCWYRIITENLRLGIYRETIAPGDELVETNHVAAEIFGYSTPEDFIASNPSDFYQDYKDRNTIHARVLANGFTVRERVTLKRQDGTSFTASVRSMALPNGDGKVEQCLGIVEDMSEREQAEEVQLVYGTLQGAVQALTATVEIMDNRTADEQKRMARLAIAIAKEMGLTEEEVTGIGLAGVLHYLGKIYLPKEILDSSEMLAEWQRSIINDHPEVGFNILKTVELRTPGFPWPIAEVVLQHHERMDGSGYPGGLSGEEILLGARVLAVADVVAAMTTDRAYRGAPGLESALNEISTNRSKLYDPDVVDACLRLFEEDGFMLDQEDEG